MRPQTQCNSCFKHRGANFSRGCFVCKRCHQRGQQCQTGGNLKLIDLGDPRQFSKVEYVFTDPAALMKRYQKAGVTQLMQAKLLTNFLQKRLERRSYLLDQVRGSMKSSRRSTTFSISPRAILKSLRLSLKLTRLCSEASHKFQKRPPTSSQTWNLLPSWGSQVDQPSQEHS